MHSFRPKLLALMAAALPALSQAQDTLPPEEIIVTSSRTPRPLSTIPNTVSVISQQDLRAQVTINNDLSTILGNMVPSFSPSRQKLTGHGETLRGRSPLYMIDGVPQSNPLRDGSRDGHTIDPLMLERVEVIHGANAIHGLGASGGIINLITRQPAQGVQQSLRLESSLQSEDISESLEYGVNYSFAGGFDNTDLLASVSYRETGVRYDADGRLVGFDTAQGDLMDTDTQNVFLKGGYNWGDQRLELTVNHFDISGHNDWLTVPGDMDAGIPTTAEEGRLPGDPSSNEATMASLVYSQEEIFGHNLRVQLFHQDFAGTYGGGTYAVFQDPALEEDLFDQSQNNSEKQGLKLTLVKDAVAGLPVNLVYGIDVFRDETWQELVQTGRNWVPETTYENYAPYLQAEFTGIERLVVTAGARHEESTLEVADFTTLAAYGSQQVEGGSPDFSETLFNLGGTYRLSDRWRLFANYSEGFSMPDVGRVLRGIDQPGLSVESFLSLEPIVTENTEAGIEFMGERLNAQLSYYTSDSDFGQRLEADADGIYSVQREKTEINGTEFRLQYFATTTDTLGLRYAMVDGEYDSDGDGSVDADLGGVDIPPDRLNLSWERVWAGDISSRLQVNHLFDRDFEDAAGIRTAEFDGYTTLDLYAQVPAFGGQFSLSVQNLTNEDFFTYYAQTTGSDTRYFKGFGRTFGVAYRMDF